ncbi:PhoD-like phosphatase N-terminal domain-containing protein [Nocardia sp. NPDC002869]|uniref:PhoD-like phosphatase N-terminal domain-containing protein n=1 Tax=Nocardia sp. NPDC002869 TaxID=3161032 RepID=UPI00398CB544
MALSRRRLLQAGTAGAAALLAGAGLASSAPYRAPRWLGDPFTLGVASGDPLPEGVVLWTRLAPDPFAPDALGGTARAPVTVEYEVAEDEHFRRIAARGSALATRELAHSVHPEVRELAGRRNRYPSAARPVPAASHGRVPGDVRTSAAAYRPAARRSLHPDAPSLRLR